MVVALEVLRPKIVVATLVALVLVLLERIEARIVAAHPVIVQLHLLHVSPVHLLVVCLAV